MTEQTFAEKVMSSGGKSFIVGGAVRDLIMGKTPHDKDYVITGVSEECFIKVFPEAKKVGNTFPVYLLYIDDISCEVAFARTERKSGHGYHGFVVSFDPSVTIEEDLYRRDSTMNAMAIDLVTKELVDPFGGKEDIASKVIKAVSHHFLDDPVRSLRAARQAAEHGFIISNATIEMMKQSKEELKTVTHDRFFKELEKALKSKHPEMFFKYLKETDLIEVCFPILTSIDESIHILEKIHTDNIIVKFAAMMSVYNVESITSLPCCYPSKLVKSAIVCSDFCDKVNSMTPEEVVEFFSVMKRYSGFFNMKDFKTVLDSREIPVPKFIDDSLFTKINSLKIQIPNDLKKEEIHKFVVEEKSKLITI